jgi:hypothetical protein
MLSPAIRTAKVAAGFSISSSFEIERAIEIVIRRRGKAAGGRGRHQWHRSGPPGLDIEEGVDIPARRLFSARRFASAATGRGSRTTLEGSPRGPAHSLRCLRHETLRLSVTETLTGARDSGKGKVPKSGRTGRSLSLGEIARSYNVEPTGRFRGFPHHEACGNYVLMDACNVGVDYRGSG